MSDPADTTAGNTGAAGAAAATASNGIPAVTTPAADSTTNANASTSGSGDGQAAAAAAAASTAAADATKTAAKTAATASADVTVALGKDYLIPATHVAEVQAFAKEHGINAKAAQAILDGRNAAVTADRQSEAAAFTKLVQGWESEIKTDKEMGGDAYDANTAIMDRAIKSFATEKFQKELESSGLIHQPEFRRFLLRVGKAGAEDGLSAARANSSGQSQQASEEAALKARYPKMYADAG